MLNDCDVANIGQHALKKKYDLVFFLNYAHIFVTVALLYLYRKGGVQTKAKLSVSRVNILAVPGITAGLGHSGNQADCASNKQVRGGRGQLSELCESVIELHPHASPLVIKLRVAIQRKGPDSLDGGACGMETGEVVSEKQNTLLNGYHTGGRLLHPPTLRKRAPSAVFEPQPGRADEARGRRAPRGQGPGRRRAGSDCAQSFQRCTLKIKTWNAARES